MPVQWAHCAIAATNFLQAEQSVPNPQRSRSRYQQIHPELYPAG
jgi:hypothetical protein